MSRCKNAERGENEKDKKNIKFIDRSVRNDKCIIRLPE